MTIIYLLLKVTVEWTALAIVRSSAHTHLWSMKQKILSIVTMDKTMTDKTSTVLEKACFLKGLRELLAKNLKVVEVVTDAHPQIESLMS